MRLLGDVEIKFETILSNLFHWIIYILFTLMLLFGGYFALRAYAFDQFIIPTNSMQPTLIPGDRVIVNKFIAGARIYDSYDFSEGVRIQSHRTRGYRTIRTNDILIFNFPINWTKNRIEFKINYVYGKRCIGSPGDSISIIDGYFYNNNYKSFLRVQEQQYRLSQIPDSLLQPHLLRAFSPSGLHTKWTIENFGPLYVPRQGDVIKLGSHNHLLYQLIIEFETGQRLTEDKGVIKLNGIPIEGYIFRKNYYFLCGDNVLDSNDSRYWGFVPEEFIVGVVTRIVYYRNLLTEEFKWDRWMRKL